MTGRTAGMKEERDEEAGQEKETGVGESWRRINVGLGEKVK